MKRPPTELKEIFANHISEKEVISEKYKEFIQQQKKKNSYFKTGRGPEYTFFQRRHTDGQQSQEKVFNITNHQENENQNHNEALPHTHQNGYYQTDKK